MLFHVLAEITVLVHFLFVLFVVAGGLFVFWRPRLAWFHAPAALYGAAIEFVGWICPLTPLENWFREQAGEMAYRTGFIEHYLLPILYPGSLTRRLQLILGTALLVGNACLYALAWLRYRRRRS